jgi:hypothetical protein
MSAALLPSYAMLWLALFRALLVRARVLPGTCGRCGHRLEREQLGEVVCRCHLV